MFNRHAVSIAAVVASLMLAHGSFSFGASRTTGNTVRRPEPIGGGPSVPITITRTFNAEALAACLLGPDLNVTGATLTAAPAAVGSFSTGTDVLGIEAGVVLSTGDVDALASTNQFEDTSTDNLTDGDPSLDALLDPPLVVSYDAAVLVIDFTAAVAGNLNLSYVFGSEEYNEFVDDEFNDTFAIFLDGTTPANNIALTQGPCATSPGLKIAINSVNCGILGTDTGAPNCPCFRDNTGATVETEMDGLTQVFVASAPLSVGPHQLKFVIGDAADSIYDAAVFIRCQTGQVPARSSTWGRVKTMYR